MRTTNVFEDVEFFGMSSYDKYFWGVQKYGSSAFKRTINYVSTTSSYVSTLWDIWARKSSKKVLFTQIQGRTWLLASYIAEVSNQVTPPDWIVPFFDIFDYMKDFRAIRRSPGKVSPLQKIQKPKNQKARKPKSPNDWSVRYDLRKLYFHCNLHLII